MVSQINPPMQHIPFFRCLIMNNRSCTLREIQRRSWPICKYIPRPFPHTNPILSSTPIAEPDLFLLFLFAHSTPGTHRIRRPCHPPLQSRQSEPHYAQIRLDPSIFGSRVRSARCRGRGRQCSICERGRRQTGLLLGCCHGAHAETMDGTLGTCQYCGVWRGGREFGCQW